MYSTKNAKRPAPAAEGPSKKRKLSSKKHTNTKKQPASKIKGKGKERAYNHEIVEIPGLSIENNDDESLLDEDLEFLAEYAHGTRFLEQLDRKGIAMSKKETERLHRIAKAPRVVRVEDDLPSIDSHDEDEESWSSDLDDVGVGSSDGEADDGSSIVSDNALVFRNDEDLETAYEAAGPRRRSSWTTKLNTPEAVHHLPIKLANGHIQKTEGQIHLSASIEQKSNSGDEDFIDGYGQSPEQSHVEDVSTGARFGRPAVVDVISNKSRKARIQGAKDQIAGICQEIISDPENSIGLLRRLHTFSLPAISTHTHPDPVPNDDVIRKLAMLSQLAVFKDIIPGYRIRPLTDKEKAEKVSQIVARTREWEQGLVGIYQSYLRSLEAEVKAQSDLADTALQSMCTLLREVTHFNFRLNIMSCVVARLSKRSWEKSSDLCLNTLISVMRQDTTGTPSLEAVRLLNRMIKERHFNVHPNVLTCLLYLRLKTELDVRASESKSEKQHDSARMKPKAAHGRRKAKSSVAPHLSKQNKKAFKEKSEIAKEMREAEAEVDKEERAVTQTETLKLLFVLYFRILKNPKPTSVLPAALQGISKFAHLVNIDFFKDLMQVLKGLILRDSDDDNVGEELGSHARDGGNIRLRLLCISTAFELLSGQGEALNIDLSDFINLLYASIPPLGLLADIENVSRDDSGLDVRSSKPQSIADMLFTALELIFSPKSAQINSPAWRSAAFGKRLLSAAINWPPITAIRAINFVQGLVAKDPRLEALLSTDDRTFDGIYRPDLDDPQSCNPLGTSFWELHLLAQKHWDQRVRQEASKLANFVR